MATRRLRAFKRWMNANGVDCSDALHLVDGVDDGVSVKAFCDLKEGDVVANISKTACLTIKTSGAREIIESAELDGSLGLAVALMYERSLGEESPWAGYLQILPIQEYLPLVWSLQDLDSLLSGTELHKIVKEDHALIYEDWKESILPLTSSLPKIVDPNSFGIKDYLAAKSLIASRSFQIDDYHGSGMVPLADLFNHKTGAEDVHFTAESSQSESDSEAEESDNVDAANEATDEDEHSIKSSSSSEQAFERSSDGNTDNEAQEGEGEEEEEENSSVLQNDLSGLKMIMVKDVPAGAEVFNTYGLMGNAALLHRYGFTEPDNPYDIVNIDLELVLEWSSSSFTSRYTRSRLALWRKLGYIGCESQNSEYFEVSSSGEPQTELLILLYILLLPETAYNKLDLTVSTTGAHLSKKGKGSSYVIKIGKHKFKLGQSGNDVLLTDGVCEALLAIVDKRESLYGSMSTLEDDIARLETCSLPRDRRLYHSLVLRVSERKILTKLRSYIHTGVDHEVSGKKRRKKMIPKS